MIKKLLMALLVALPFSSMAQKFGVVDLESIFTSMPESAAMQTQLQETTTKYEEEFGKLQEEVNKLYTEYQTIANDANTPESIKERRVQEIQERAAKVDQFRNTAQQDIQRLQEQLMAPISQRINEAVRAVGAEGGFTFIFPNEPSLLLFSGSDVVDVTPYAPNSACLQPLPQHLQPQQHDNRQQYSDAGRSFRLRRALSFSYTSHAARQQTIRFRTSHQSPRLRSGL